MSFNWNLVMCLKFSQPLGSQNPRMIIRLRQFLTIFLLLLFSLENVANASIYNAGRENFSVSHNVSTQKESLAIFTWIIEQNENEERDDDKTHGLAAEFAPVSLLKA